ncbi:MAG: RNA polymerase sigma factor [Ignavibacteriae bacterium]|nr:RNA polymerase sigma factor [Ignavibacteriota bacterium]MCI0707916.1 RNA polymerase sigma factor [Ignavibacteriota bacterium]
MFIDARPLTTDTQEILLESTERTNLTPAVLLAQSGNREAFEQIYREHVGRVYAVCIRICGDRVRAEELTQDVFVRTWQMLPTFRGESAFSSWLHRLAVNVVLVDYRAQRRRTSRVYTAENLEQYDSPETASAPGDAIDLEDAVRQLPPQARAIFILHDIEGYKHEEIAEQLELAVGTCKAQLHRARKLLKEVLEP